MKKAKKVNQKAPQSLVGVKRKSSTELKSEEGVGQQVKFKKAVQVKKRLLESNIVTLQTITEEVKSQDGEKKDDHDK